MTFLIDSYSRVTKFILCSQVKMNPARSDNMIIQSICLLDQLDKDLNTFAMRVREWYCWHFPELRELVKDNYMFARCASFIKVGPAVSTKTSPRVHTLLLHNLISRYCSADFASTSFTCFRPL